MARGAETILPGRKRSQRYWRLSMPWVRADKRRHVVKLNVTKKDFEGLVQSLSVLVIDVQDRTTSKRLATSGNHFAHLLSGFGF